MHVLFMNVFLVILFDNFLHETLLKVLVDLVKWLRRQGSSQLSRIDSGEEEYGEGKGCFQRAMSGLCGNIFG